MQIQLFGALQIRHGGRTLRGGDLGGAKPRAILELLLLARGRTVSKDRLADALWGERPPRNIAAALEHHVCVLRQRLCDDPDLAHRVVVTEPGAYRLDTSLVEVDVDEFDRLVRDAETGDDDHRRTLLARAVELAQDELLDDAPYAPWTLHDRDRYREKVARAHLWLARDAMSGHHFVQTLRHAEDALRVAPYSETAFRMIMVADHGLGHTDLARRAYARCRQVLSEHLAATPSPATESLAAEIAAGTPVAALVASLTGTATVAAPRTLAIAAA